MTIRARVLRPGRKVDLVEAELVAGGRTAMRVTAWRIRVADIGLPGDPGEPPPPPEQAEPAYFPPEWSSGYLGNTEWRNLRGGFHLPGPAAVWARLRVPVVDGEEPSPLQRLLAVADSGNGASGRLDLATWLFVNPDLTVHVVRPPEGEWVLLDARSELAADGTGLARSVLSDRSGVSAYGAQSLIVEPR